MSRRASRQSTLRRTAAVLPLRSRALAGTLVLAYVSGLAAPQAAWAQVAPEAPSSDASREPEAAEKFREGRLLLDQGRFEEACQRFEASLSLASSPATLLNLGNCYEQYRQPPDLLRARAAFERALAEAEGEEDLERRQAWSTAARERLEAVTARLPKLTLRPSPTPGVRVLVDGQPATEMNAPLLLNPGDHRIEAHAPGKVPFAEQVTLASGQNRELTLPALADAPVPGPIPAPARVELMPPADEPLDESRFGVLPWALMGGGGAMILGALIPGLMAKSKMEELDRQCSGTTDDQGRRICDPALKSKNDSALTLATVADVLWISGAVVAGVGVTLYVLDDGDGETATTLDAGCFEGGCGVSARGQF